MVLRWRESRKKGDKKMRQNFLKLLKTHVEKMSIFRLSTILMKTNELGMSFHDVDENKGRTAEAAKRGLAYNGG